MSKYNRLSIKLSYRLSMYLVATGYALWRAAWMTVVVILVNDIVLGKGSIADLLRGVVAFPDVGKFYLIVLAAVVFSAYLSASVVALAEAAHRTDPAFWSKIRKDRT